MGLRWSILAQASRVVSCTLVRCVMTVPSSAFLTSRQIRLKPHAIGKKAATLAWAGFLFLTRGENIIYKRTG